MAGNMKISININRPTVAKLQEKLNLALVNRTRDMFRSGSMYERGIKQAVNYAARSLVLGEESRAIKYRNVKGVKSTEMWRWINDAGPKGGIAMLGLESMESSNLLLDAFLRSVRSNVQVSASSKPGGIAKIVIKAFDIDELRQYTPYSEFAFTYADQLANATVIDFIDGQTVGAAYKTKDPEKRGLSKDKKHAMSLLSKRKEKKSRTYLAHRVSGFVPYMTPHKGTWSIKSSNPAVANWRQEVFSATNKQILRKGIVDYVQNKLKRRFSKTIMR